MISMGKEHTSLILAPLDGDQNIIITQVVDSHPSGYNLRGVRLV
jgi:hypothetical protein